MTSIPPTGPGSQSDHGAQRPIDLPASAQAPVQSPAPNAGQLSPLPVRVRPDASSPGAESFVPRRAPLQARPATIVVDPRSPDIGSVFRSLGIHIEECQSSGRPASPEDLAWHDELGHVLVVADVLAAGMPGQVFTQIPQDFLGLLPLLLRPNRARIVDATLGMDGTRPSLISRGLALGSLARNGMAYLDVTQRANIVDATLALDDERERGLALSGMGQAMPYLTEIQRERVIRAAIAIKDERFRSNALAGLGQGIAHLSDPQRTLVLEAATKMRSEKERADALAGLAKGVKDLSKDQLESFFKAAMSIGEANERAYMLATLVKELAHFSEPKREEIVSAALAIDGIEDHSRGALLGELGAQLVLVDWSQRTDVVNAVFESGDKLALDGLASGADRLRGSALPYLIQAVKHMDGGENVIALSSLWVGMARLVPDRRDEMVANATSMRDAEHKDLALHGVAAVMAQLSDTQRESVIGAIRDIVNERGRSNALLELGRDAAVLTESERTHLIDIAINMDEGFHKTRALAALGTGAAYMSREQRTRILDAVEHIANPRDKMAVLAGLGEGLAAIWRQ